MKLMTKELEARFAEIGSQSQEIDPIVVAKFFDPLGSATWLATEYEPKDKVFMGYVKGLVPGEWNDEWGSFALDKLEAEKGLLGLGIERDVGFTERRFSDALHKEYCKRLFPKLFAARELRAKEEEKNQQYENRMAQVKAMQKDRSHEKEDGLERA